MPVAGLPSPALQANKDGSVTVNYVPTQNGVHELNLSYNETPVEGQLHDHRWRSKGSGMGGGVRNYFP